MFGPVAGEKLFVGRYRVVCSEKRQIMRWAIHYIVLKEGRN